MLSKIKRDEIARELSLKYDEPYFEIRAEITDLLTGYAHVIKDYATDADISREEAEMNVIYKHFKNRYE